MPTPSSRDPWVKKAKWLTQALIISGALNVGLLSTFLYLSLAKEKSVLSVELKNSSEQATLTSAGMEELLSSCSNLSFEELVHRLSDRKHVESGLSERDLALGCLVSFHHFNIERALGGYPVEKRQLTATHKSLTVFPGLADYQFQAIISYAKTERWPLTSEGLFYEIQKREPPFESSLVEAALLTPEFHFIHLLFTKTGLHLKKDHLITLLGQGKWETIQKTSQHLRAATNFTSEDRRDLLVKLTQEGSKVAAKVLLETDLNYCSKHFDNEEVYSLCTLLGDRTPAPFLKEMITAARSEAVWQKAAAILYEQAAEEVPERLNLDDVQMRFIHLKTPPRVVLSKQKPKTYKVAQGDSLWKIARNHNTSVQALRKANHLESDRLQIGQELIIPWN